MFDSWTIDFGPHDLSRVSVKIREKSRAGTDCRGINCLVAVSALTQRLRTDTALLNSAPTSVVCAFPDRCLHVSSRCLHTSSRSQRTDTSLSYSALTSVLSVGLCISFVEQCTQSRTYSLHSISCTQPLHTLPQSAQMHPFRSSALTQLTDTGRALTHSALTRCTLLTLYVAGSSEMKDNLQ